MLSDEYDYKSMKKSDVGRGSGYIDKVFFLINLTII